MEAEGYYRLLSQMSGDPNVDVMTAFFRNAHIGLCVNCVGYVG